MTATVTTPPSELGKLTAPGRADVLPGYTLTRFRLSMFAECEAEFARVHLAAAAGAGIGLPEPLQDKLVNAAMRDVRDGVFNYGATAFDGRAWAQSSTPFLVWVALRPAHPKVTRAEAEALVTPANEDALYFVLRVELMGYPDPRLPRGKVPAAQGGPSAGNPSTPPSENADSPPPTSPQ